MVRGRRPPRDATLSAVVAVLVVAFLALGWWQVTRALGGNSLSWAYVFEWPLFAAYLIYMWRRLSRERAAPPPPAGHGPEAEAGAGGTVGPGEEPEAGSGPADTEEDEELAAYNRYLASLEESGRRKRW